MNLMQKCLLFPMVGLKSEIIAFIADNFTVEFCCRTYGPFCITQTMNLDNPWYANEYTI